jgi:hypothetical protein
VKSCHLKLTTRYSNWQRVIQAIPNDAQHTCAAARARALCLKKREGFIWFSKKFRNKTHAVCASSTMNKLRSYVKRAQIHETFLTYKYSAVYTLQAIE